MFGYGVNVLEGHNVVYVVMKSPEKSREKVLKFGLL